MASTEPAKPRRGEIWLTAFGAARPGEPGKTRPAVVVSADGQLSGSVHDLVVVAPLSSSLVQTGSRPTLRARPDTGLTADSVVVVRAIRGMSRTRLIRRLGVVDALTLASVQDILSALLDLP